MLFKYYCRLAYFVLLGLCCDVPGAHAHEPAQDMRKAAENWLHASSNLTAKAVFPFQSGERTNWNFVPMSRLGASLGEMTEGQKELTRKLLRSALSAHGYLQASTIVSLELVLREIEGSDFRDPGRYFLSIFGKPSDRETWGWRFEGHHLSLNFVIVDGQRVTVAPSFFGSNPADSAKAGKVTRPLAGEEDLARALVKTFTPEQSSIAVFAQEAPREIITGTRRTIPLLEPAGIGYSSLSAGQQASLRELVGVYVNRYRRELAREDLARIEKAGWTNVSFAWAGGQEKGQGHYYRVQGPAFLLEYDNTQNHANHIHTVWRDRERDFGGDLLTEHYRSSGHHDQKPPAGR